MKVKRKFNWFLKVLPWFIIGLGLTLRIVVFFQNRNLIIDEANIVRNIYERSFAQLFVPLNYEQFAPPLFLCISKCELMFLSSAEWSLRLFPFICGLINLILFYSLLKKINLKSAIFYPLFLFATGMIYVRYASELKQYSSDILVSLSLWLLAIKYEIGRTKRFRLSIIWLLVGSIAIWLSMPSVFILGAIGFYYFYDAYLQQCLKKVTPFSFVISLWLVQFFIYYLLVLKPSTNSEYLQNAHFEHEFILTPKSLQDWIHNRDTLFTFFSLLGGHWILSLFVNISLIILGFAQFWRKNKKYFFLFGLPVFFMFVAVFFRQFTLMPRVCLFIYPALLLLIGLGLESILALSTNYFYRIAIIALCLINLNNFSEIQWIIKAPKFDRTTEGFEWIKKRNKDNHPIFLHHLVKPQQIYYTCIHPDSSRWKDFKNVNIFDWQTNMDSFTNSIKGEAYFMCWWAPEDELKRELESIHNHLIIHDSINRQNFIVYKVYGKSN